MELPIHASHLNPAFFPAPEEFRPERFLKQNLADLKPFTYRPFGGMSKNCVNANAVFYNLCSILQVGLVSALRNVSPSAKSR